MNYLNEYNRWVKKGIMKEELLCLNEKEIEECFYKKLTFGTGGIRAIMGPGPNRLNIYTIRKSAEGYAKFIESKGREAKRKGIVIAFDNRNNSQDFALEAAKVLATHEINVYLFDSLRPTPELSFAIRYLNAQGGIVITASHNPPEYNGFKTYDHHGCQSVIKDTDTIINYINGIDDILNIAINNDKIKYITYISDNIDKAYYKELMTVQERPELEKNIKVVYTPLHGTGNLPVRKMLGDIGYKIYVVKEQCEPDPTFSKVASPNPENKNAYQQAIQLAVKVQADLVIATDPDCDRVGIVVRHNNKYEYMTGNQVGAVLLEYLLSSKTKKGTLPTNGIVFDTIVTASLGARVASKYGVEVESTLTGFKFIGDKIREYNGKKSFLFGYEESCGYMIKDFTRDKDAVQSSILITEACEYYKSKGKTLIDVLDDLYKEHGYLEDIHESKLLPGIAGEKEIERLVNKYRFGDIDKIENRKVIAKEDYKLSIRYENGEETALQLPKSNVIKFFLEDGSWVAIRPSGNEPKIKYYKNLWK